MIRGTVTPIGTPIQSVIAPSVTGVVQVIKLRYSILAHVNIAHFIKKNCLCMFCSEHRITRGFAGFWTEQRKLIHLSSNEVPFKISNGDASVEIIDALSSEILGMVGSIA